MNRISLFMFIMGLLMITSASPRSAIHTLFVDPSDDPFLDPYIETVSYMNTKDIMAIPKMADEEFLQYLHNENSVAVHRHARQVDTSIFDPLRDEQLKHQPDIDKEWETLMVSGPIVVGYMGNLLVLSSKQDFPFKAPQNYTYRYIRYPNSFRATLVQASSDMYDALMGAHTAMDRIQLAVQQIPTNVKKAMKIIISASDKMLKSMLPLTLESIGRLATESAQIANSTLLRFNALQDLLGEIIELSAATQSTNEAEIEEMNRQIQNTTLEQERLAKNLELIERQYDQSRTSLEAARQEYVKAMEHLKASSTPIVLTEGNPLFDLVTIGIGLVFGPVGALGGILGSVGLDSTQQRVDNTNFENALKIAQAAKDRLEQAEQLHNSHFQLQLARQNELARTIGEMAMLDLSVLSTEEIVHLLIKATKQISLIREQWARMIEFFSKLAAQAHSTQQVVVHDFIDVIQQAQTDDLLIDPTDREFFVEILVPAATTIESGAHLLYIMAKTYYAISSEHMITQIAGIGQMLALQTDEERTGQLQLASNTTLVTSMKITSLVQERHALYLQETHNRQAEYTAYIDSLAEIELRK